MSATVTIRAEGLERKLARFALLSRKDLSEAVEEGARRFISAAVRNTMPMILSQSPAAARREWQGRITHYFETHRVTRKGYRKEDKLRRLLSHKKKALGREAAGWNAAANRLKASRMPAWVKRHGESEGRCLIRRSGTHLVISVTNSVPYNEEMTRRRAQFALSKTEAGLDGNLRVLKRRLLRSLR